MISPIAGLLSIICPHIIFYKKCRELIGLKKFESTTLSILAAKKKDTTHWLRIILHLNGFFSLIFLNGLSKGLYFPGSYIIKIASVLVMILFFLSAFLLGRHMLLHRLASILLLIVLWGVKIVTGIYIDNHLLTLFSFTIAFLDIFFMITLLFKYNWRFNAIEEISFTTLLSIWVFVFSIYLLLV